MMKSGLKGDLSKKNSFIPSDANQEKDKEEKLPRENYCSKNERQNYINKYLYNRIGRGRSFEFQSNLAAFVHESIMAPVSIYPTISKQMMMKVIDQVRSKWEFFWMKAKKIISTNYVEEKVKSSEEMKEKTIGFRG